MRIIALFAIALAGCSDPYAEAKEIAAAELKDPSSAQFRELKSYGDLVCGEINGKNSYGGYVGFEPFYVQDGEATLVQKSGDNLVDVTNELRIVNVCADAQMKETNKELQS